MNLHNIREEYCQQELSENECAAEPLEQLKIWLNQAIEAQVNEPTAMNLATISVDGKPSSRVVLLKEINQQGLVFFSNYHSQKGQALSKHPYAAVTFFWAELERQVRLEGKVFRLPESESDAYFASRPYASRIGAWASEQSQIISGKHILLTRAATIAAKHPINVPRPPYWGGYLVKPECVEFWQGRPSRLHDRIRYRLNNHQWIQERLAP